ncbi:hypothetical protein UFOVP934_4 [uncultured Caudovirales phage]|uniref:Uncharacterized protein n=1 Tax=uncultured Caudovirales phage TaxID=2100421 RepID=A0A6J5PKW9_9CAUD|nr:hypothetical protein UFOVP934_4 [uncultured Caudovirales phage]
MTSTSYNGWTNFATWRVNLEIFSDFDLDDWCLDMLDANELAGWMRDHVREIIEETAQPGLARDYALAFLADVNWFELAKTARDDYAANNAQEELDV